MKTSWQTSQEKTKKKKRIIFLAKKLSYCLPLKRCTSGLVHAAVETASNAAAMQDHKFN